MNFVFIIVGLLVGIFLFWRIPLLLGDGDANPAETVSVIIPARNEEKNLPTLLRDLNKQTFKPYEIICVDDHSEDSTAKTSQEFGAKVISLPDAPSGWTGKTWACQCGADASSGELLLFLDADISLNPKALSCLLHTFRKEHCVISVQPFHIVKRAFEHLSLFFNLILFAANGAGIPFSLHHIGLFGPVVLIEKTQFHSIGGYSSVSGSSVEDLAMGKVLREHGIKYRLFSGGSEISFVMYQSLKELFFGWTKNFASGAAKTPFWLLLCTILWVFSSTATAIGLIKAILFFTPFNTVIYGLLYIVWVCELYFTSRKIGCFNFLAFLLYPLPLLGFHLLFLCSLIQKYLFKSVTWKGRKIKLER